MLNKKRIPLVNILGILIIVVCALPLHASNLEKSQIKTEDTLTNKKKEKVDAYTLREWQKILQDDPEVNLSEMAPQVLLILQSTDEQKSYFENIHSFIPSSPPISSEIKVVVDSNVHYGDLTDIVSELIIYATHAAQRGDMINSRNALKLVPDVALRPIDLIPSSEVVFFGKNISGNEVYNFVYQPALRSVYLLTIAIDTIKPYVKNPQSLNHLSTELKATIEQLANIVKQKQSLMEQSKKNSSEMHELSVKTKNILRQFMLSLKPEIERTFQPIIAESAKYSGKK